MAKTRVYSYNIFYDDRKSRITKRLELKYISEFTYTTSSEWLEYSRDYVISDKQVIFVEEEDNEFYIYLRKKKYLLEKGVNII